MTRLRNKKEGGGGRERGVLWGRWRSKQAVRMVRLPARASGTVSQTPSSTPTPTGRESSTGILFAAAPILLSGDFPGRPVVKTACFHCRGVRVRSLVEKVRSCSGATKKLKKKKILSALTPGRSTQDKNIQALPEVVSEHSRMDRDRQGLWPKRSF